MSKAHSYFFQKKGNLKENTVSFGSYGDSKASIRLFKGSDFFQPICTENFAKAGFFDKIK